MDFDKVIDEMAARWASNVVARKKIDKFSGGILSPRTLANEDSRGTGIPGRFLLMNQVVYPVASVISWLKDRAASDWKNRKKGAEL